MLNHRFFIRPLVLVFFLSHLFLDIGCCDNNDDVAIVYEGDARAVIVIPGNNASSKKHTDPVRMGQRSGIGRFVEGLASPDQEIVSALELQHCIFKATGVTLEIIGENEIDKNRDITKIYLGLCNNTLSDIKIKSLIKSLMPEESIITVRNNNLYIIGQDQGMFDQPVNGTLNGTYRFLELFLDVKWLFPGELGEIIPLKKNIVLKNNYLASYRPLLRQRHFRDVVANRSKYNRQLRGVLRKYNILGYGQYLSAFSTKTTGLWFRRHQGGGRILPANPGGSILCGYWQRYKDEYPEIFALQSDGTRNQHRSKNRPRMCLSQPKLWDLFTHDVLQKVRANPQNMIAINPADGGGNQYCLCEACRKLDAPDAATIPSRENAVDPLSGEADEDYPSLSDRYFYFYNIIAERVGKQFPDRPLLSLAYTVYKSPPVKVKNLEPNLYVSYVGIGTASIRDEIKEWSKRTPNLIVRPNYMAWRGHYLFGFPMNHARELAGWIRYCIKHNVTCFDFDGGYGLWGANALEYYVLVETLKNPKSNTEQLIKEYCSCAYGKGGPEMRDYFDKIEKITENIYAEKKYDPWGRRRSIGKLATYYNKEVISMLKERLLKAKALAGKEDLNSIKRVEIQEDVLGYTSVFSDIALALDRVETPEDLKEYLSYKDERIKFMENKFNRLAYAAMSTVLPSFDYHLQIYEKKKKESMDIEETRKSNILAKETLKRTLCRHP